MPYRCTLQAEFALRAADQAASEWEVPLVESLSKIGVVFGSNLDELQLCLEVYFWAAPMHLLAQEVTNPKWSVDVSGTQKCVQLVSAHRVRMNKKSSMDTTDVWYSAFDR